MITELNHVGLSVSNLERSLAFYRDVLGMEVVIQAPFEGGRYEIITGLTGAKGRAVLLQLKGTSLQVELFEFSHPKPKPADPQRPVCDHGITHFCMSVKDIESEYQRLKAANVAFHCPPQVSATSKVTYGRDPDGNVFELLERLSAHE